MDDNPAEEDDDFELDLEAVDVVSFGPPVVFMGFIELEFESIPVAMSRGWRFVDFTNSYLITGGTRHERSLLKVKRQIATRGAPCDPRTLSD